MPASAATRLKGFHAFQDSVRWRVTPRGVAIEGRGRRADARRAGDGQPGLGAVPRPDQRRGDAVRRPRPVDRGDDLHRVERPRRRDPARAALRLGRGDARPGQPRPDADADLDGARGAEQPEDRPQVALRPGQLDHGGDGVHREPGGATSLDPPLVAAGYNAGSLRHNTSPRNRWKLLQYPIDSSEHCDRFVKWFNDACFALARHPIAPTVGLERLIGIDGARRLDAGKIAAGKAGAAAKAARALAAAKSDGPPVALGWGPSARKNVVSPKSAQHHQGHPPQRRPEDRARHLDAADARGAGARDVPNLEAAGVAAQKALYGPNGDTSSTRTRRPRRPARTPPRSRRR